jgi:hypothetical protein
VLSKTESGKKGGIGKLTPMLRTLYLGRAGIQLPQRMFRLEEIGMKRVLSAFCCIALAAVPVLAQKKTNNLSISPGKPT